MPSFSDRQARRLSHRCQKYAPNLCNLMPVSRSVAASRHQGFGYLFGLIKQIRSLRNRIHRTGPFIRRRCLSTNPKRVSHISYLGYTRPCTCPGWAVPGEHKNGTLARLEAAGVVRVQKRIRAIKERLKTGRRPHQSSSATIVDGVGFLNCLQDLGQVIFQTQRSSLVLHVSQAWHPLYVSLFRRNSVVSAPFSAAVERIYRARAVLLLLDLGLRRSLQFSFRLLSEKQLVGWCSTLSDHEPVISHVNPFLGRCSFLMHSYGLSDPTAKMQENHVAVAIE